jgi:hypothetical protein
MGINEGLYSNSISKIIPNDPINNHTILFIRSDDVETSDLFYASRPPTPDHLNNNEFDSNPTPVPSAEVIAQRVESTINEMGSYLPEHKISGHNELTREGYKGGFAIDLVDGREEHGFPNFKPFTNNLADYLESYHEQENAQVNEYGFPHMDPTSIR